MATALFPESLNVVEGEPTLLESYSSDAIYRASPAAVARPSSIDEVQRLLTFCNEQGIGVTPCGGQTSLTGGSVSDGGLVLSLEKLACDWRIREDPERRGRWLVDAGPAVNLAELQDALAEKGFFYPPDPTSRADVMLAATIATNASGEDSYKYGATRRWVRGLTYVRADGRLVRVDRDPDQDGDPRKNTCGYPIRDSEIDLLIGSEGTLGVIVEATLEVLPRAPDYFALLFFMPSEEQALDQVLILDGSADFDLRCLEYMDEGALRILRSKGVVAPEKARAALYIKQEFDGDEAEKTEQWCGHLEDLYAALGCPELMEHVHFAGNPTGQRELRAWRHHIPATINETAARYKNKGGGKVGTDWYAPLAKIKEMFAFARRDQAEMDWVVFGHIGNGHPHFNFICKNETEYRLGRALLAKHCAHAVALGGGVSGEHGLGKLKSHLLAIQFSPSEIEAMRAIKREMDPGNILGKGNIFP